MPILRNLTFGQRVGLALVIGACVYALLAATTAGAETLQCYPAHTPYRASEGFQMDPALFGLIVTIGTILFLW